MFARWDLVPLILAKARIRRTDSGPSHNRPKVTAQLRVEKGRERHDKATSRGRPPCCLQPAPESPTSPSQKSRRSLPHGPFPSKYSTVPQSAPSAQPGQLYPRCSISVVFFLCPLFRHFHFCLPSACVRSHPVTFNLSPGARRPPPPPVTRAVVRPVISIGHNYHILLCIISAEEAQLLFARASIRQLPPVTCFFSFVF